MTDAIDHTLDQAENIFDRQIVSEARAELAKLREEAVGWQKQLANANQFYADKYKNRVELEAGMEKLSAYFRDHEPEWGRDGDDAGWSAAQTAVVAMKKLREQLKEAHVAKQPTLVDCIRRVQESAKAAAKKVTFYADVGVVVDNRAMTDRKST